MSPDHDAKSPDDLNFDKAVYEGASGQKTACTICKLPLKERYFSVNQNVVCPACKESLEQQFQKGNPAGRVLKALGFGVPAAVLGFGIYYAISALTGYEFGLIAIVIGYMVGWAVRKGSGDRGGVPYQLIAVLLTYMSISSTYVPYMIQGFKEEEARQQNIEETEDPAGSSQETVALDPAAIVVPVEERDIAKSPSPEGGDAVDSASPKTAEGEETVTQVPVVITYAVLFLLAMAAPFLSGFQNIIGLLILGFGLFEAWKINKKVVLDIQGPFDMR